MIAVVTPGPVMDAFEAGLEVAQWIGLAWITCSFGALIFRRIIGV